MYLQHNYGQILILFEFILMKSIPLCDEDFELKMTINDVFYNTQEKSWMAVTYGSLEIFPTSNFRLLNVKRDLFLAKLDREKSWILLAPYKRIIYQLKRIEMDLTLTKYVFNEAVITFTFLGLWNSESENDLLVPIRLNAILAILCKTKGNIIIFDN
ncbi:hypothetical protein RF11_06539 [Thelohanellus kitauei]|uniref:Uncharacterized protein n=1 Tax=Thelohanellus kitauei TaxID=669202 RepID=A0A0C2JJN4_THEKT|nr:hypothetical protein RF11_06539 [Thelohanellus kitauei]